MRGNRITTNDGGDEDGEARAHPARPSQVHRGAREDENGGMKRGNEVSSSSCFVYC